MAHFNECSGLVKGIEEASDQYEYAMEYGLDPLQLMIDLQKSLQVRLHKSKPNICMDPDNLATAGDHVNWLREQKDCIDDEFRELITSLGEMSRGDKDASAVWKKWKSRYEDAAGKNVSDFTKEDQLEVKFEMIDIFHFVLNMFIGLNMNAEEIFELYYLKNAENFKRQDNNY